jgi:hypothetical protein
VIPFGDFLAKTIHHSKNRMSDGMQKNPTAFLYYNGGTQLELSDYFLKPRTTCLEIISRPRGEA